MKNADMPVYPTHTVYQDCGIDGNSGPVLTETILHGLTKREYFAANAPDVPDWFLPADQMNAWHENDTKRKAEIFFEWRVFYANKMLSALENQNDPT